MQIYFNKLFDNFKPFFKLLRACTVDTKQKYFVYNLDEPTPQLLFLRD